MPTWKEGDRVRIVTRPTTEEDKKANRYYDHMAGLVGVVQNVYNETEIAVKVDLDCLNKVTAEVQKESNRRMQEKFAGQASEEQKKQLSKEELEFTAHYVQLVQSSDLEKA